MTAPEDAARRALVTGASRGIGAAIARELAARGHEVLINYRTSADAAEALVAEIAAAGGRARALAFDVADAASTAAAIESVLAEGPVQILVNNAGTHDDAAFPAMKADAWSSVLDTNLGGFFNVTRPLVMPMVRERWGRIINMSSVSGVVGNRGQVNYSAAKAGLIGATRALSQELAKRKITVNAVAPGLVETEMLDQLDERQREAAMGLIPMRRFGRPEEVAKLVGFLASEDAAYITGQVIGINGGMI